LRFYRLLYSSNPVSLSVCYNRDPWLNTSMFSEANITTNYPRDLAHGTTLLIDLTLGEHLQILGERRGSMYTIPAISLKWSSLEPKLLQSVCRNSCGLSIGDKAGHLAWSIFPQEISRTLFVGARRNLTALGVWPIETYSLHEFRELCSVDPVIPCGDMHQCFTGALVKWFLDNFPMFADSFRLVSVHCVQVRCPRISCELSVQLSRIAQ